MAENDAILSDDALLDLLCVEEDRVSRAAVDDILRRAQSLRPRLIKLADDHEFWHSHDWAPVHATFLLAAMKGPGALDAVLRALEMAAEHDHPYVIDVADSLLAAFGPEAVPALIAAHADASAYVKIWINDGLSHIADAHPAARDAVRDHLRKIALGDDDEEICACAALVLLPLVTPADREALEILVDRKLIEDGEMETALTTPAELALSKPVDWLSFYSAEEIERRQEAGADSDEDEEDPDLDGALPDSPSLDVLSRLEGPAGPAPILNAAPKVGRNDPCPCGSGKKFKKCCGA